MAFKLAESDWEKQRTAMSPTLLSLAAELDVAASLRVGAMDSASRASEISTQQQTILRSVAARLKLLAVPNTI